MSDKRDGGPLPQLAASTRRETERKCEHEGCDSKHYARGLCQNHYRQARYHAEPQHRQDLLARHRAQYARRQAARRAEHERND